MPRHDEPGIGVLDNRISSSRRAYAMSPPLPAAHVPCFARLPPSQFCQSNRRRPDTIDCCVFLGPSTFAVCWSSWCCRWGVRAIGGGRLVRGGERSSARRREGSGPAIRNARGGIGRERREGKRDFELCRCGPSQGAKRARPLLRRPQPATTPRRPLRPNLTHLSSTRSIYLKTSSEVSPRSLPLPLPLPLLRPTAASPSPGLFSKALGGTSEALSTGNHYGLYGKRSARAHARDHQAVRDGAPTPRSRSVASLSCRYRNSPSLAKPCRNHAHHKGLRTRGSPAPPPGPHAKRIH